MIDVFSTIQVNLSSRSYPIIVGDGAVKKLPELIPSGVRKIAVISQENIPFSLGELGGIDPEIIYVGDGESSKSLRNLESIADQLVAKDFHRNDLIIGLGGGVVTDLAGFVASTFHRGLSLIQVPTTLVGQVDAAIGGKTGVNLKGGKNLVGSFFQPKAVICDLSALSTLPEREWKNGYGEIAKYCLIGAGDLTKVPLLEQVLRSASFKAKVVEEDEFEQSGRRAILNYGHTLAHGLEALGFASDSKASLRHGEAVSIGIAYAAKLALELGRIDESNYLEQLNILAHFKLETKLPAESEANLLIEVMKRDKKSAGELTFVLDGPRGIEVVNSVPTEAVRKVLVELGAK